MRIAILGYGDQGRSAYEYWAEGNDITICDAHQPANLPAGVKTQLGENYLKGLDQFDLLIRTPSLYPQDIVLANQEVADILDKVTSVTNEFFKVCPSKNIIGVTGTKGKGTTSTLIALMLEAAGKRVHLGGNIGTPPLDMLKNGIQPDDWVVLELANFQLIDIDYSPAIGVCLMVAPEHLDWHSDVEDYVAAKQVMFTRQTAGDLAVYNANNELSKKVVDVSPARKLGYDVPRVGAEPRLVEAANVSTGTIYMQEIPVCPIDKVVLRGRHNLENICAAASAVWDIVEAKPAPLAQVIQTFQGLEHRLEFVREVDGVKFFDDSFGTTPETAIVAIQAFTEPKVVILGGSDKGASYDVLAQTVMQNDVRAVVLIGKTAPAIEASLRKSGYSNIHHGGNIMPEIVAKARSLAQSGDVVLLSTACASFDMFKNYKDRGEQFKRDVNYLIP